MKLILKIFFSLLLIYSNNFFAQSKIEISGVWARPAASGTNSALYFSIHNIGTTPDTLTGVESKIADIVEIHETYKRNNDRMGMRAVDFVAVSSKSKTELKPGSFHVMLIDLQKDLRTGDSFEALLHFKHSGKIKIKAEVKDAPAMKMKH